MKYLLISAICLLTISVIKCQNQDGTSFDKFFDNVLKARMKKDAEKPLNVTNEISAKFSRKILFATISGEITLANISIWLKALNRTGPSELENLPDGAKKIITRMSLSDLRLEGNSRIKALGIGPERKIRGKFVK